MDFINAVDADFRVFYGYEGLADGYVPDDISGPRFIAMCEALPGYRGAVRMQFERILAEQEQETDGNQHAGRVPGRGDGSGQEMPAEAALGHQAFRSEPEKGLPPVFEVIKPSV